jgi:hypothetical protein
LGYLDGLQVQSLHTETVTLLFVDIESKLVVGLSPFPNMGGPGKIDHGPVFQQFKEDLYQFEKDDDNRVFSSRHFSANVEIHTVIMFIIQDQPERRQASCLLGGNSTLQPLFGVSCDFSELMQPFFACIDCMNNAKDWSSPPMTSDCPNCVSWSLDRLMDQFYKTRHPIPVNLDDDSPGATLFDRPGRLTSKMLGDAWNHCIKMFAVKHCWLEANAKKYLHQLCIND